MQNDDLLNQEPKSNGIADDTSRDVLYARLYKETVVERDRLRKSFEQAREYLRVGKFRESLTICEEVLAINPANPLFIGLKLQVESQQWKQHMDYLRDVSSRLEYTPEVDQQIEIVQEALTRYPSDPQLMDLCRNVKARRDLLTYAVASARRAEDWQEYGSAIERWGIVKEFHPAYPGLNAEILRCEKLRAEQGRTEKKSARIWECQGLVQRGQYAKALAMCERAIQEFPDDQELFTLRADLKKSVANASDAGELLARAREQMTHEPETGLLLLYRAYELDRNNEQIRRSLGGALLERAKAQSDLEPMKAVQLILEARELIPDDPGLDEFAGVVARHKEYAANTPQLRGESPERQPLRGYPSKLAAEDHITVLAVPSDRPSAIPAAARSPQALIGQIKSASRFLSVETGKEAVRRSAAFANFLWDRLHAQMTRVGIPDTQIVRAALISVPAILVLAFITTTMRTPKQVVAPQRSSTGDVAVSITANPPGARLLLDDGTVGAGSIAPRLTFGPHTVTASAPGYISQTLQFSAKTGVSPVKLTLKPEPLTVRVNANVDWATVSVDNSAPVPLDAGSVSLEEIQPGGHVVEFVGKRSKMLTRFEFEPGAAPKVASIDATADLVALIVANYGGKTRLLSSRTPTMIAIDGKMLSLPANGIEVELSPGEHRVELGTANGNGYVMNAGGKPDLAVTMFPAQSKVTAASNSRPKVETDPQVYLSEVRNLMAGKRYVEAESKLALVLAASPENEAALRIRKDLDTVRRLDPDSWK